MLYKHEKWKNLEDGMSRYTDKSSEIIEALQDLYSIYDDGL